MSKMAMIHPDHLLDQARRGAASPEAWQQLGAHLAACRACAFERAAADDFAREQEAISLEAFDVGHLDRLVEGALSRASSEIAPRPRREEPARAAVARGASSAARWVAAAAVIAAAIGALITMVTPSRGARTDRSFAAPSEASLDAGASPLVGGDS